MTDNIGEQMTDEELHAAQPQKDFEFTLVDTEVRTLPRQVVVPNWIARDGHWGDVYNALIAARNGNMATATEKITRAMERARQFGREEAESEAEELRRRQFEGRFVTPKPDYVARPLTEEAKIRAHRDTVNSEDSDAMYRGLDNYRRGQTEYDRGSSLQ